MASKEEILQKRKRDAAQRAMKERLAPAVPAGKAALTALDYPRHGTTESIQRIGELTQASRREGGGLSGAVGAFKHLGRESLSDIFDVAADVVPGVPESWGERLDPSQQTGLGADLELEKERFRHLEGRDPSIIELYDMKTQLQDVAMPSLTKRRKIGPLEFSNRALYEAGGEVGAVAGEILATGGTATIARGIGKAATKGGAAVAASQFEKGATRAALGKAAGETIKKTGTVAKINSRG